MFHDTDTLFLTRAHSSHGPSVAGWEGHSGSLDKWPAAQDTFPQSNLAPTKPWALPAPPPHQPFPCVLQDFTELESHSTQPAQIGFFA
jgi:hypothetical protein